METVILSRRADAASAGREVLDAASASDSACCKRGGHRPSERRFTVVLGCFDGVHIAHSRLIEEGRRLARERETALAVWTLRGLSKSGHCLLTDTEEKLRLFEALGADAVFISDYEEIRQLSPEQFVHDILICGIGADTVVCGYNFTFGLGAVGNSELLSALMTECGRSCTVLPAVTVDGFPVSSTEIRRLLAEGDVARAARLLGRPYSLCGEVVHGRRNGRALGFPTANLSVGASFCIPKNGVYLTSFSVGGQSYPSVTNVGTNPTLGGNAVTVETYILDFSGDIYGEPARVTFISRDRDELCFSGTDELRAAIVGSVERRRRQDVRG